MGSLSRHAWVVAALTLSACSARPAIGGTDDDESGEGTSGATDDGTTSTSGTASGSGTSASSGTSNSTGDPDTGETDSDSGPPPDCSPGLDPGVLWTTTLDSGSMSWADAVAVDHMLEVSVAGNDGENPALWRLDQDGALRWKFQASFAGRAFGVDVNELGEPFMGWNQPDAVTYLHFGVDGDGLLESTAFTAQRFGEDLAVVPPNGPAMAGFMQVFDQHDLRVLRFADNGNLLWEVPGPDWGGTDGRGVAVADDRIVVAGDGGGDFMVRAYALDGALLWQRIIEGGPNEYATSVAVAPSGDFVVGGACLDQNMNPSRGWLGRFDPATGEDAWPNEHTCGDWVFGPVLDVDVTPSGAIVAATELGNTPAIVGVNAFSETAWSHEFLAPNDVVLSVNTLATDDCGDVTVAGRSNQKAWASRVRPEG